MYDDLIIFQFNKFRKKSIENIGIGRNAISEGMVWSNAKDGFLNRFKFEAYFKISSIFYKPNLSFEPRVFISDFDGSVINVDDEEKILLLVKS